MSTSRQLPRQLPENPKSYPLSFGQFDFPKDTEKEITSEMPFDGWIARVDAGWPAGANNTIGFNLRVNGDDPIAPRNFEPGENIEFIVADDTAFPLHVIHGPIDKGEEIVVTVDNGSTTNSLDLQPLIVTVTNFNPVLLGGIL